MKIAMNVVQHLPAAAVRDAVARPWACAPTNGRVAAAHAGATTLDVTFRAATAGTAVAPSKRTAQFLIRDSSPPV